MTRRNLLSAFAAATLGADSPYDPEIDPIRSKSGFVISPALGYLAGAAGAFPVWLQGDRLSKQPAGSDAGIAVLFDDPASYDSISLSWEERTEYVYASHSYVVRMLPSYIRVIDARTARVAFTSQLPEAAFDSARSAIELSPIEHASRTSFNCGVYRSFSMLYRIEHNAPFEEYFTDRPLTLLQAVNYRSYLRQSSHIAALIEELNPGFTRWFWRRVADVPELPTPEQLCTTERERWLQLLRR